MNMANEIFSLNEKYMDEDFKKIFEIIDLKSVNSIEDANELIFYLTDCANPLREACSLKLEEICPKYFQYFLNEYSKQKLLKAITDINPNVSRAICSIFSKTKEIADYIELDVILAIKNLLIEIEDYENENKDFFRNSIRNTKSHAKNKKLFALYWLLEALFFCFSGKYNAEVLELLNVTINFNDFTIREKTAQLLQKTKDVPLELLKKAKHDQNFYVKIQVYDKINFDD